MIDKQQHKLTCGPVAIKNALTFTGVRSSYMEILNFSKEFLEYKLSEGMRSHIVSRGLKLLGIPHVVKRNVTFDSIRRELKQGHGVILLYKWVRKYSTGEKRYGGHYVFIDKEVKKSFRAWNGPHKTAYMPKTYLAHVLGYSARHYKDYPWMAVIKLP